MKFEALGGHANKFSIRLNDQYRLEFEIEFSDKEKTKGNLTPEEEKFLLEVKNNLTKVYNKKLNKNSG